MLTHSWFLLSHYFSTCVFQVVGEGVTGVCGGKVNSSSHSELVVSTFSGQVLGLTRDGASRVSVSSLQPDLLEKIESLRYTSYRNCCCVLNE